ncbi:MAG: hypothetical protein ACFFFG_18080 [Candidatus Thorarchaeota archaeon]
MHTISEPVFKKEKELEKTIGKAITFILSQNANIVDFFAFHGRFDLCVLIHNNRKVTYTRFIEVKHFSRANSRIGLNGAQVDLLIHNSEDLLWLNKHITWIFGDSTKAKGSNRFQMLNNVQAKGCVYNKVRRGKQNNFSLKKVMEAPLFWNELLKELNRFLVE